MTADCLYIIGERWFLHFTIYEKPKKHKISVILEGILRIISILLSDINECKRENGGCEQACENLPGDYTCECTDAGFVKDLDDFKKCVGTFRIFNYHIHS